MSQTVVQKQNTVRFGSGKFEVGEDIGSLVDLGAMRGVKFAEEWEEARVESDNAGDILIQIRNQEVVLTGEQLEIDLENLNLLRGGIDVLETEAGTPVSGANQILNEGDWGFKKFIKIENQNGDSSPITVNSVTGSADGALTAEVDYFVVVDENGNYGISFADDSAANLTTEAQNITVDYDYTPSAAVILSSGGKFTINPRVVRITNTNEEGKIFQITVFKAENAKGIEIEFQSDDSGEVAVNPLEFRGTKDVNRPVGKQLFEIRDEQSPA